MPKSNCSFHKYQQCCLVLFIIVLYFSTASADVKLQPKSKIAPVAEIVWSEVTGGTYHIFYSGLKNSQSWSPKIQISESDALNLAPSISSGSNGVTWIVWSIVEGANSRLLYCFFDGEKWSDPKEIPTNLSSNTSPSITVDRDNSPWVAWTGFDGTDDDIYYSKWNENEWSIPSKVNLDNDVPDVLPRLVYTSDNILSIFWSGFNGDTYSQYVSMLVNDRWSEKKAVDSQTYKAFIANEIKRMPVLPEFIKEPEKASIHLRMQNRLQSIPLQEMRLIHE